MEAVVLATVIGKVKMRFLYEERVFGGDDAAMEDAVTYRAVNVAVLVAEDVALVNMTRVNLSFALFAVLVMKNLKIGTF